MRNTKKWLVILLALVMLVSNLSVTAMATENKSPIELGVPSAAEVGKTMQVRITASEAQAVADGKLVLTYDSKSLAYVGANAWSDEVTLSVNPTAGKIILAFANADAAEAGDVFVLNFIAYVPGTTTVAIDGSSYLTGVEADLAQERSFEIIERTTVIASGWSGYTNWTLTDNGVLTVVPTEERFEGKCNMKNYCKVNGVLTLPWSEYADLITKVVIEEGVNAVGQMAFYELPNLQEVVLPESIDEVRNYAFKNVVTLTTINLNVVEAVREGAFYGCTALQVIDLPEGAVVEDWAFTKVPGYKGEN